MKNIEFSFSDLNTLIETKRETVIIEKRENTAKIG